MSTQSSGQGNRTHEQFLRNLEHKDDLNDTGEGTAAGPAAAPPHPPHRPDVRQSEFPVSRGGMNQESSHNKHHTAPAGAAKHNGAKD